MELRTNRISTLVMGAVLSCAASGCSGGGAGGDALDAASAGGAADVSSDAQGGATDSDLQPSASIIARDTAGFRLAATKVDGRGVDGECRNCKARVAEPLPAPSPAPFKSGAAEMPR
jgi:hypothetical protein